MSIKAKSSQTAEDYIAMLDPPVKEVAAELRSFVLKFSPKLEEGIKWGHPTYSKNSIVCYIGAYKDHVNFGFWKGADMKDPNGLLEGSGKGLRHVKVYTVKDIKKGAFRKLLKEAVQIDSK